MCNLDANRQLIRAVEESQVMDDGMVAVVTAGQRGHARGGIPALRSRSARVRKQAEPGAQLGSLGAAEVTDSARLVAISERAGR